MMSRACTYLYASKHAHLCRTLGPRYLSSGHWTSEETIEDVFFSAFYTKMIIFDLSLFSAMKWLLDKCHRLIGETSFTAN